MMANKDETKQPTSAIERAKAEYAKKMEGRNAEMEEYVKFLKNSLRRYFPYLMSLTKDDRAYLDTLGVETKTRKSYFVYSPSETQLMKFAAYYLAKCGAIVFREYFVRELASLLVDGDPMDDNSSIYVMEDLLILYNHRNNNYLGKSEDFVYGQVINKVTERNRLRLPTLILSEVKDEKYINSGEFEEITLTLGKLQSAVKGVTESRPVNSNAGEKSKDWEK